MGAGPQHGASDYEEDGVVSRRIAVITVVLLVAALAPMAMAGADNGVCGDPYSPIYDIQGPGDASPIEGEDVTTEGVVTVDLQSEPLGGFFLEDLAGDDDPSTSDGVFVYQKDYWGGYEFDVSVGDYIRITAEVDEYYGNTQLKYVDELTNCGNAKAKPTKVDARTFNADNESFEGMYLQFQRTLEVTNTYELQRHGEVWLGERGVVEQPTNEFVPGDDADNFAADNAARAVLLDDRNTTRYAYPDPIPFLRDGGTLRLGDTAQHLTGGIYFSYYEYRVMPDDDVAFKAKNKRPAVPAVGGKLVVASANVLNYFATLDESGAACFPSMTRSDCRGANTAAQLEVQTEKLVAELLGLKADIIGLQEVENDPAHGAIEMLVAAMNDVAGPDTWAWVGEVDRYAAYPIRNEIIYRTDAVMPVGGPVTLPAYSEPFEGTPTGRLPIAQTFDFDGDVFTVMVNHLKSKSCYDLTPGNEDMGDGQACWNLLRTQQADVVLDFVDYLVDETGDPDVLMVGDLNAYLKEDPVVQVLETELKNLVTKWNKDPYSYNYYTYASALWIGRGLIDHAFATPSLQKQVNKARIWHINADEPRFLDWYDPTIYAPGPYRASDHDPVRIGLNLR